MMYGSKKIIWQKPNGDIVERIINGFQFYRVGDGNAYKWKIIDIKYCYKKRWCSEKDYIKLIHKDAQIEKLILSFKNNLTKAYKQVLYCLSMMIFFKIYEVASNVIM